ncbi:MarR family winged helix-turn-helix transcriptional regulator [Geobacter sp. AOG2]|uniref:MarR family winged helix-turn-helix transcriptional regulator n=1 Tax=Geobacter sp. AOG2 TaxID=1566347 RepID=UPI001CC45F03|nr:MarR family transcriptional regulator [Geobacter sp. AOG2]GFE62853.1 transcriptional regulator [Geobacter sp. AOG2]
MLTADDALGFVINAVARKFSQLFNIRFKAFDITAEQWSILSKLVEHNGITQRELASITEKDANNITKLLDRLEKKGWVRRVDHPLDRRSYALHVTEEGEQLAAKLKPLDQKFAMELLTTLTVDEVEHFQKTLRKINLVLSDKISKP